MVNLTLAKYRIFMTVSNTTYCTTGSVYTYACHTLQTDAAYRVHACGEAHVFVLQANGSGPE